MWRLSPAAIFLRDSAMLITDFCGTLNLRRDRRAQLRSARDVWGYRSPGYRRVAGCTGAATIDDTLDRQAIVDRLDLNPVFREINEAV